MNKKTILIGLSIIIFSLSSIAIAQIDPPPPPPPPSVPERISGGVVNGKALSLPKPNYPAAALAANIRGSVNVAVVISKSGSIMSASATSGHPLLRSAAVAAARLAQFVPTTLSGQAVEVSGVLVYNFIPPEKYDVTEDGDAIGDGYDNEKVADYPVDENGEVMEATREPSTENGIKTFKDFPVLASSTLLSAFQYLGKDEKAATVFIGFVKRTPSLSEKAKLYKDFSSKTFEEQKAIVTDLQNTLRSSSDSSEVWQYQMGVLIGQMMGQFGNFEKDLKPIKEKDLQVLLEKVADLNYSSPEDFPERLLEKFVKISQYADHENLGSTETQKEIFRIMNEAF